MAIRFSQQPSVPTCYRLLLFDEPACFPKFDQPTGCILFLLMPFSIQSSNFGYLVISFVYTLPSWFLGKSLSPGDPSWSVAPFLSSSPYLLTWLSSVDHVHSGLFSDVSASGCNEPSLPPSPGPVMSSFFLSFIHLVPKTRPSHASFISLFHSEWISVYKTKIYKKMFCSLNNFPVENFSKIIFKVFAM